jgi:murein DD-endopeptidase MepM/ murein hydrolase activator NlpD
MALPWIWVSAFLFSGCFGGSSGKQLNGVYHTVKTGQTLYQIAKAYEVELDNLKRVNGISDPTKMQVGQRLWIPEAIRVLDVAVTGRVKTAVRKKKSKPKVKKVSFGKLPKGYFVWPIEKGIITSKYGIRGRRHHDGIDIANKKGTPIYASASGKVVFSGTGPTGYGLMVIIKHKNGLMSVYAHNSANHVGRGLKVKQGQKIASMGSTGRSTGPHLHFEIRNDAQTVNPLSYLPKKITKR